MRSVRLLLAGLLAVSGTGAVAAGVATPAAAAETGCAAAWGSLAVTAPLTSTGVLTDVRAGRHDCLDRLVVDVDGDAPGYRAEYVQEFGTLGAGDLVPLRGGAVLQVVVEAPAYDDAWSPTYLPADRAEVVDVAGLDAIRQVAWGGSFEGQTSLGVGVHARLPFRVLTLDVPGGGSRVVVDVAHDW